MKQTITLKCRKIVMNIVLMLIVVGASAMVGHSASAATSSDLASLKKLVLTAYKGYSTDVDVSSLSLYSSTDKDNIKDVMTEVINETPYLFYTGQNYTLQMVKTTQKITKIQLTYADAYLKSDGTVNKSKIKKTTTKINAAISTAMKCVNSKMTKVEKALALHDYIIQNTAYTDNTSKAYRLTEVGVFINHRANCQGYSLAYNMLLTKAGISSKFVTSDTMAHMWNLVKVGGNWYNVDVTWDDPVDTNASKDQYGMVDHEYFLCSTSNFESNDHYGFSASDATSTKYDSKYWRNITSAFQYRNGKWLYLGKSGITQRSSLTSGKATVLYHISGKTMVKYTINKYYFIAYNRVYMYNRVTNSVTSIWNPTSKYSSAYYLTQIKYSGGKVYYRVLKGSKHKSGSFSIKKNGTAA